MRKWKVVVMEWYYSPRTVKKGFKTKKEALEFMEQYKKENRPWYPINIDFEDSPECFGSELQYSADGCETNCVFCSECWRRILKEKKKNG